MLSILNICCCSIQVGLAPVPNKGKLARDFKLCFSDIDVVLLSRLCVEDSAFHQHDAYGLKLMTSVLIHSL